MPRDRQIYSRRLLTNLTLERLRSALDPQDSAAEATIVGDHGAPKAGGWQGGQPGLGGFTAYVAVFSGQGTPKDRSPVGGENDDWTQVYTLRSVGGSRDQAEWIGDEARTALVTWAPVALDLGTDKGWKLQRVAFNALGPADKNIATDPPYWETIDSLGLWLARDTG